MKFFVFVEKTKGILQMFLGKNIVPCFNKFILFFDRCLGPTAIQFSSTVATMRMGNVLHPVGEGQIWSTPQNKEIICFFMSGLDCDCIGSGFLCRVYLTN